MHFYANFELGMLPPLNSTLETFPTNSQITFLKTPKYRIIKIRKAMANNKKTMMISKITRSSTSRR
jgi:hypothetical protein